jgi:hypothetical protein
MANRLWAQFFGRGIVNPVDDMHDGNVPSHPELLQELAGQFAISGFDLKYLVRAICNSHAYQRTSKQSDKDDDTAALYSHMAIKIASPEQLYDSLMLAVVPVTPKPAGKGRGPVNPQMKGAGNANGRANFVAFFQTEEGTDPTEYQAGIPQVLKLMNDPRFTGGSGLVEEIVKSSKPPVQGVEKLYLATLSRRPTAGETQRLASFVRGHSAEPRRAYSDVLWALLNSSEFTLNH